MATYRKRGTKWEYRVRYVDRKTGTNKETSKGGFNTKKEAQIAANLAESKVEYYGVGEGGNDRLANYFPQWLEIYKKPNVKPITYTLQERNVRLNILPRWGRYRLKELNRSEYQKWINELRTSYSEGTVRRIHSIMNTAISDAVHEFNILRENPLVKIKIPKDQTDNKTIKYFSKNQLEKFFQPAKRQLKMQSINCLLKIIICLQCYLEQECELAKL